MTDTKNKKRRARLTNKNVTIISSNCIGGVIYKKLALKFLSPTINASIVPSDFIKLCKNLDYYLSDDANIEEVKDSGKDYPVALLEDIYLHAEHYNSYEEFVDKWSTRSKRVNYDNLCLIMSERDGCTEEDLYEFDKLPFEHKVVFVKAPNDKIKSSFYINDSVEICDGIKQVKPLTFLKEKGFTGERYIDDFDYVSFLNNIKTDTN